MKMSEINKYKKENHSIEDMVGHPDYSHVEFYHAWYEGQVDHFAIYFNCEDSVTGLLMVGNIPADDLHTSLVSAAMLKKTTPTLD